MDASKEEFLKEFGQHYGYPNAPNTIDQIRATQFKRLQDLVYLDHATATLYSELQMDSVFKDLTSNVYGNPHSQSDSGPATLDTVKDARQQFAAASCASKLDEKKAFFLPVLDVPDEATVMQEEIFGPILPIVTVENIEDSFSIIKSKPKPLAAYLFTNDEELKKAYVENISFGGMLINDTVIHVATKGLPFGGVEESGMGSYHGKFSYDSFSHKKSVMYKSFDADTDFRYPP